MASKFLSLDEAAQILGLASEQLNDMRQRGELFGVRDGGSWKFKSEEIDRVRDALQAGSSSLSDDADEVVLLSEFELGDSGPSPSSTVIGSPLARPGKPPVGKPSDSSDLQIKGSSAIDTPPESGGPHSDVQLAAMDTDLKLGGFGDSSPANQPADAGEPSGLPIDLGDASGSENSSDLGLLDSDLGLGDLRLGDDLEISTDKPGSEINLGSPDEAEGNVLDGMGSSAGSDITHRPSDSGILLIDPADSGISLDQAPLDLVGGSDDLLSQTAGDSGLLKADDDFLLTTLDESVEDESDSGSQVIMLDTEGEFDDATATLLGTQLPGGGGIALEDGLGLGGAPVMRGGLSPQPAMVAVAQESPFTTWAVVGLVACTLMLSLTGMMMYDLIRNMWSWDGPYALNSSLMDWILGKK